MCSTQIFTKANHSIKSDPEISHLTFLISLPAAFTSAAFSVLLRPSNQLIYKVKVKLFLCLGITQWPRTGDWK
jgi:hypothetical protein